VKCNESDQRIPYCLTAAIVSAIPIEHIRGLGEQWQFALEYICPELSSGTNTDRHSGWTSRALGKAVAEALASFAQESPVVILVDDIHWADKTSVDLLAYALGQIVALRVCVIVTRTDGEG
jgi:predicted ATPase